MPSLPLSPIPANRAAFHDAEENELHEPSCRDRQSPLKKRRRWLLLGLALVGITVFASHTSQITNFSEARREAWAHMGSTEKLPSEPCERTFLYEFTGTKGFGSEFGIFLRGALWARHHNYTLLVESAPEWVYGSYDSYFHLPPLDCVPPNDAYDRRSTVSVGKQGWEDAQHLSMTRGQYQPVDMWMMRTLMDVEAVNALPDLDLSKPLPWGTSVPEPASGAFEALSETMQDLWRPVDKLKDMVWDLEQELGLQQEERGHAIGVHFRGGDKLAHECPIEDNCGNVTLYLEAALQTLSHLSPASCSSCKPTLLLMTIEPDALAQFQSDPLAEAFDIRPLPSPASGLKGHNQHSFNTWPLDERVDDTLVMLRDLEVLSTKADAFVVSMSSNVGLTAGMLAGPDSHRVQSLDQRFLPTTRPAEWYTARGVDYTTAGR